MDTHDILEGGARSPSLSPTALPDYDRDFSHTFLEKMEAAQNAARPISPERDLGFEMQAAQLGPDLTAEDAVAYLEEQIAMG